MTGDIKTLRQTRCKICCKRIYGIQILHMYPICKCPGREMVDAKWEKNQTNCPDGVVMPGSEELV
jgi:hypothetical protein